jgi:SAM-dependent methyltransferase
MNPAEFANIAKSERDLWWYRGMRQILFRVLDPCLRSREIHRVLEVGCGTGYLSGWLQKERGWRLVALDCSREGLGYARTLAVERPVQADMRALPFPAGAFSLVLAIDVLAHLWPGEEQQAAGELARVVAPGGLLVVRASAFDFLRSRHSQFVFERQRFTRRRLAGLMANAGFRGLRCTYANSLLLPVAAVKFRIFEPLFHRPPRSGVERLPGWLDRLLYVPLACEARWIGRGRNLPAGQSLVWIGEKTV